jgi:hypothetical protein
MKIFPLIERVLDKLYNQIPGSVAAKNNEVNRALKRLSDRYGHLTIKDNPIDYSNPAIRWRTSISISPRPLYGSKA